MSFCGEHSLVGEGVAISLPCRCWSCENCQPLKRAQLERLALAGEATHFITLTCNPDRYRSPCAAARALKAAWVRARGKLKRLFGERLPFLAVFEVTRDGWPHLHILARSKRSVSQGWLSEQMRKLMGAPIVHVRPARPGDASYIAKGPHKFGGCKRYWTSLDWRLFPVVTFPELARRTWRFVRAPLAQVERGLRRLGITEIWHPNRFRTEWSPP